MRRVVDLLMDAVAATVELVQDRARELDVLESAVIATDPAGKVVYWNDAAEDLYGRHRHPGVRGSLNG